MTGQTMTSAMTSTLGQGTASDAPIALASFNRWLLRALPGQQLEYHRGHLIWDRSPASSLAEGERRALARVADAAWQATFDRSPDKAGGKRCQRYRHVHLPHAASLSLCDAGRCRGRVGDQFIQPTAPAGDRRDQGCSGLRAKRTSVLRRDGGRQQDLAAPR